MDLDHAAATVARRIRERRAALAPEADPQVAAKFDRISSPAASVARIKN